MNQKRKHTRTKNLASTETFNYQHAVDWKTSGSPKD